MHSCTPEDFVSKLLMFSMFEYSCLFSVFFGINGSRLETGLTRQTTVLTLDGLTKISFDQGYIYIYIGDDV